MQIQTLSLQAQLAQAAYASVNPGMNSQQLADALDEPGMGDFTRTQAQQFTDKYEVVLQYNDTAAEGGMDSGLSVTVFRDLNTQKLSVAGCAAASFIGRANAAAGAAWAQCASYKPHTSRAYCAIVRSLEKLPICATLAMALAVQASGLRQSASTRACAAR